MDFLQILDLPLQPGGLVEWTPVLHGSAELSADPRPTSHNHEQHLRDALDYQAITGHTGGREAWLGVSIEFDEPLSIPAIRLALAAWIDRHEVLRSHVLGSKTPGADGTRAGFRRVTAPPGSVSVAMTRVGWYHDETLLVEQLAGWFDRGTAPVWWPAYRFATVGRGDSFTLLFAGDHSLLDGYSLVMSVPELRAYYRDAVVEAGRRAPDSPALELPPAHTVGSYVDYSGVEREAADLADGDHPAVQAWASFLADGMPRYPRLPTSAPLTDHPHRPPDHAHGFAASGFEGGSDSAAGLEPQHSYYALLADDATTEEFTAVCAAAGTTLFAGVMAGLALASCERLVAAGAAGPTTDPPSRFRAVLPRHTRSEPQWQSALGWFVSLSPFDLDIAGAKSFSEMAQRAAAELRRGRIGASLPLLRVDEILGSTESPQFAISYLDTRSSPGAEHDDAGGARVLRSHRYAEEEVYLWVNRTPAGLRVSARYPSALDEDVRGLCAAFAKVIEDVGRTAGQHIGA